MNIWSVHGSSSRIRLDPVGDPIVVGFFARRQTSKCDGVEEDDHGNVTIGTDERVRGAVPRFLILLAHVGATMSPN